MEMVHKVFVNKADMLQHAEMYLVFPKRSADPARIASLRKQQKRIANRI